ncbi:MAG: hypothetical protein RQ760_03910, partial [Sedimentisphaerales bacterium]|nr:hypothetical protein [Sedimentisphaerales bacterium]
VLAFNNETEKQLSRFIDNHLDKMRPLFKQSAPKFLFKAMKRKPQLPNLSIYSIQTASFQTEMWFLRPF